MQDTQNLRPSFKAVCKGGHEQKITFLHFLFLDFATSCLRINYFRK